MEDLKQDLMERLKQQLRPEFLNRVDEIVVFRPLGREQIRRIVEIQFERTRRMAEKNHGLTLVLTDAAKDLLAKEGFDPAFGARPLKRVLQRQVANRLAEQILAGFVRDGDTVTIDAAEDGTGVTLTTDASEGEAAALNGKATAPKAEA
jgi:ATP-dependent Clp protease ATP-binding subunit ClpB